MMDTLLLLATWACGTIGFAFLAFTQKQHWALLHRSGQPMGGLRPLGWTMLGLAVIPAICRDGVAFGLLVWTMLLTVSACAVVGAILVLSRRNNSAGFRLPEAASPAPDRES